MCPKEKDLTRSRGEAKGAKGRWKTDEILTFKASQKKPGEQISGL
jgi:hypothetical protein